MQERGYEGLVAKREDAPYRPSTEWLKVKVRHEVRFLVGGVCLGGVRRGLVVGERIAGALVHRGLVFEFGVGRALLYHLADSSLVRRTSPFGRLRLPSVVWLEPRLIVEVTYSELTRGRLRDPVFGGFVHGDAVASRSAVLARP